MDVALIVADDVVLIVAEQKGWTERYPSTMAVLIAVVTLVGGALVQRHDEQQIAQVQREGLAAAYIAEACAIGRQASADLLSIQGGLSRHHAPGVDLPPEDVVFQHNLEKIGDLRVSDIDLLYRIHTGDLALRDLSLFEGAIRRGNLVTLQDPTLVEKFVGELRVLEMTTKTVAAHLQNEFPTAGKCVSHTSHGNDWMAPQPELIG